MADEIAPLYYKIIGDDSQLQATLKSIREKAKSQAIKLSVGIGDDSRLRATLKWIREREKFHPIKVPVSIDEGGVARQFKKIKLNAKPILDLSAAKEQLNNLFKPRTIKVTLDTSSAQQQLNSLHGRSSGGGSSRSGGGRGGGSGGGGGGGRRTPREEDDDLPKGKGVGAQLGRLLTAIPGRTYRLGRAMQTAGQFAPLVAGGFLAYEAIQEYVNRQRQQEESNWKMGLASAYGTQQDVLAARKADAEMHLEQERSFWRHPITNSARYVPGLENLVPESEGEWRARLAVANFTQQESKIRRTEEMYSMRFENQMLGYSTDRTSAWDSTWEQQKIANQESKARRDEALRKKKHERAVSRNELLDPEITTMEGENAAADVADKLALAGKMELQSKLYAIKSEEAFAILNARTGGGGTFAEIESRRKGAIDLIEAKKGELTPDAMKSEKSRIESEYRMQRFSEAEKLVGMEASARILQFQNEGGGNYTGRRLKIMEEKSLELRKYGAWRETPFNSDTHQAALRVAKKYDAEDQAVKKEQVENLRQMTEAINIAREGLSSFGGELKQKEAEIREEYRRSSFGAEPEQKARAAEMMEVKLQTLYRQERYGATRTQIHLEGMEAGNEAMRLRLQGRDYEAEKMSAEKEGERAIEEIEARKEAGGFRSTNEYLRTLNAQKDRNALALAEIDYHRNSEMAESVGSFVVPGAPRRGRIPAKPNAIGPKEEFTNDVMDWLDDMMKKGEADENRNAGDKAREARGESSEQQFDQMINLLSQINDGIGELTGPVAQ